MATQQPFKLVTLIGSESYDGTNIVKYLLKGIEMPYTIKRNDFGDRYPNGSATGAIAMLDRGEADVLAVASTIGYLFEAQVGNSFPFRITTKVFAALKYHN